jgi:hypothetical protein
MFKMFYSQKGREVNVYFLGEHALFETNEKSVNVGVPRPKANAILALELISALA